MGAEQQRGWTKSAQLVAGIGLAVAQIAAPERASAQAADLCSSPRVSCVLIPGILSIGEGLLVDVGAGEPLDGSQLVGGDISRCSVDERDDLAKFGREDAAFAMTIKIEDMNAPLDQMVANLCESRFLVSDLAARLDELGIGAMDDSNRWSPTQVPTEIPLPDLTIATPTVSASQTPYVQYIPEEGGSTGEKTIVNENGRNDYDNLIKSLNDIIHSDTVKMIGYLLGLSVGIPMLYLLPKSLVEGGFNVIFEIFERPERVEPISPSREEFDQWESTCAENEENFTRAWTESNAGAFKEVAKAKKERDDEAESSRPFWVHNFGAGDKKSVEKEDSHNNSTKGDLESHIAWTLEEVERKIAKAEEEARRQNDLDNKLFNRIMKLREYWKADKRNLNANEAKSWYRLENSDTWQKLLKWQRGKDTEEKDGKTD